METGMNTLQKIKFKVYNIILTVSPYYLIKTAHFEATM